MTGDPKPARKQWVIVGLIVLVIAGLALSPPTFRESLSKSIKSFILKVHNAPRQ